ncbi:hypothetical protein JCM3770_000954 [Rhodotorula araucariae]
MQASPPLQLPGYTWDPEAKRFFKAPTSAAKHTPASSARTASSRHRLAQAQNESAAKKRKRARKTHDKGKWRAIEPAGLGALRNLDLARWDTAGRRDRLRNDLCATSMSRLSSVRTIYPDCVPVDDSILHLSFDEVAPTTLRIGTSSGTIATGQLARPADELAYYPNDEEGWRTSWFCPSKITSLKTCGERIVATSLGPPAQAVVGTTRDNISLASVTLSPRKTSLWTSAISPTLLALGCDKKVLLWSDPSRAGQMDAYTTGGNRGDGTVFALDLHEELVFAGTRKGRVHMFDRRASRGGTEQGGGGGKRSERETRDEMQLSLASPVTHLRHLKERPHQLVVAGMDGFLGVFDLRFPPPSSARVASASRATADGGTRPSPLLELKGHVNSFITDLGFDVWRDEWVAAAGQDNRLRLWSLRTGAPILPSTPFSSSTTFLPTTVQVPPVPYGSTLPLCYPSLSPSHPLLRGFSAPLKAVSFAPLDPLRLRSPGYAERLSGDGGDRALDDAPRWGAPSLWVADGAGVEGFAVV